MKETEGMAHQDAPVNAVEATSVAKNMVTMASLGRNSKSDTHSPTGRHCVTDLLDNSKTSKLEKVRAKSIPRKHRRLIATGHPRPAHDDLVPTIKTRNAEVFIKGVNFKTRQAVVAILGPFPNVAHGIKKVRFNGGVESDGRFAAPSQVQVRDLVLPKALSAVA